MFLKIGIVMKLLGDDVVCLEEIKWNPRSILINLTLVFPAQLPISKVEKIIIFSAANSTMGKIIFSHKRYHYSHNLFFILLLLRNSGQKSSLLLATPVTWPICLVLIMIISKNLSPTNTATGFIAFLYALRTFGALHAAASRQYPGLIRKGSEQ